MIQPHGLPKYQRGFYGYVIGACVLLAAIGAAAINQARTAARGNYLYSTTATVYSAALTIQGKVRMCPIQFPGGNNGTGYSPQYPGATTATAVNAVTCPGRSGYILFTGGDGVFLPPTPSGFTGWNYLNDASGVRIILTSDGNSDRNTILQSVTNKLSSSVATYASNTLTVWIKR